MGSYFYNRDLLGDKFVENLKQVLFERSHFPWKSSPLVFQSCLSIVFHASYVFQDVLLLMNLFLITEKLLFPVHPFQFQLLWNRYKNTDALQLLWNRYKNTDALQTIVVEVNQ